MTALRYVPLAGILLLAGCALVAGPTISGGSATLTLLPDVRDGGYRSQAQVGAYGPSDINHLQVKLFKMVGESEQAILGAGGAQLMLDLPQASLSAPVTFSNLDFDTTYRVRSYAYLDAGTGNLISTTDASSSVDVAVTRDDRPTLATLPIQMIDRFFDGQGSPTIAVTPGTVASEGTLGIDFFSGTVTLAGTAGTSGSTDGTGAAAKFKNPAGVALDATGNLYVADRSNHAIRKITAGGVVTTLAGTAGTEGSTDGIGTAASFYRPSGLALDGSGNLYVADQYNHTIRKIVLSTGAVTTLAGTAGTSGSTDGTGAAARFYRPFGLALDGSGNLYVVDTNNYTIRQIVITSGAVTTLAGTAGSYEYINGTGSDARFDNPQGIAADGSGNLYVADAGNNAIRKIVISSGLVTTLAGGTGGSTDGTGTAAKFLSPQGVALDGLGDLYVVDSVNNLIRKVTVAGVVTTFAGRASQIDSAGSVDGSLLEARFREPTAMAVAGSGDLYVSDSGNHTIRKITP